MDAGNRNFVLVEKGGKFIIGGNEAITVELKDRGGGWGVGKVWGRGRRGRGRRRRGRGWCRWGRGWGRRRR